MSVIRPQPPEDPIQYEPAATIAAGAVSQAALDALGPRLDAARAESLADLDRWRSGGTRPGEVKRRVPCPGCTIILRSNRSTG